MDSSWIDLPNNHPNYFKGCMEFLELAKKNLIEEKTLCPCNKCKLNKWFTIEDVGGHILFNGFLKSYRSWNFHREHVGSCSSGRTDKLSTVQPNVVGKDDMDGLIRAALGVNNPHSTPENLVQSLNEQDHEQEKIGSNIEEVGARCPLFNSPEEEAKYKKLMDAADDALYEGCTTFSKLSFILRLFHFKCMFHWSAESLNKLLELLIDAFPQIKEFPTSYYEGKKIIKELGLGYEKIDACPNNCMLYWGELANREECQICRTSRWKINKGKDGGTSEKKGESAKVMRYFSLIPRLKRLYMSSKTASDMRWHKEGQDRKNDNILRHPADGLAWKMFDDRYEDFASDSRNIRLGLASDGFNPYRLMSTNYSTWPVVLIPYNLPPWLCMKASSFILSVLIPGKLGPGNKIDVFLQPLIHELKLLWVGVDAFDAYTGKNFKLRASLHYTINDFPAYAMLSGWSTKGYKACPACTHSTYAYKFGNKICYVGTRKWLDADHPYRSQGYLFDGTVEYGQAPIRATGTDILREQEKAMLREQENFECVEGNRKRSSKKRGRLQPVDGEEGQEGDSDDTNPILCTKKSIFFDLEYWEHNPLRHNLDVMHIEKNVCDNILGTLLDMDKSRDDHRARKDLENRNIKPHLWLQDSYMPPASYSLSTQEKERFLKVLQKLKVPDGYGSNLSRCVNLKQRKLMNMKSHDNHVLMQDILPIALRASKATNVIELLAELSSFFKMLCSNTIAINDLDDLQTKIVLVLCEMEKEFLPTFFTIMVHLLLHLVEEVRLGGPVHYRWMYPIERYLAFLKSNVTNKAQPEGSIAEGYLLRETLIFCSRYLEGVETMFNRPRRNEDGVTNMSAYLYNSGCRVIGKKENFILDELSLRQAHRYVLLHCDELKPALDDFIQLKRQESGGSLVAENIEFEWVINDFADWLQSQVHNINDHGAEGKLRKALAGGLCNRCKRLSGVFINGYKFVTSGRERYRKTQNSGIVLQADGQEYYGKLKDIYELNYYGVYKVVVFRCHWVDINRALKANPDGSVCVNFSKLMHTGRNLCDDPFIFSSQARQVFYVEDETKKGWLHVIKTKPRDLFDIGEDEEMF